MVAYQRVQAPYHNMIGLYHRKSVALIRIIPNKALRMRLYLSGLSPLVWSARLLQLGTFIQGDLPSRRIKECDFSPDGRSALPLSYVSPFAVGSGRARRMRGPTRSARSISCCVAINNEALQRLGEALAGPLMSSLQSAGAIPASLVV